MNTNLMEKARRVFQGKVVDKALVRSAGLPRLPRYVVEHLIANHLHRPDRIQEDLRMMREHIAGIFPETDSREKLRAQLMRDGEIVIIDKASAVANLRTGKLDCALTFIGESNVEILDAVIVQYPRLLTGGLWGGYRLKYMHNSDSKGFKVVIVGIMPFQAEEPDLQDFAECREAFTTAEWVDLLLISIGYDPYRLPIRTKLLYLARMIPAVEANVNLLELGPRQTGKTYLLRNISPSVYTASGSNVSSAGLFANLSSGNMGILSSFKIVQLDEIAHTRFDDISTISMLKDYMESGQFARGGKTYSSDASLVLAGNIEVDGSVPSGQYRHLFEPLPNELQDTAFLDRVHGYIPGWEIPKVTPASLSSGYGLVVDYIGQVCMALRARDRRNVVHTVGLPKEMTQRDVIAMEKMTSGIIKLAFPHDQYDEEELIGVANLAAEMRQRVNNELAKMSPGEFSVKNFMMERRVQLKAV